MQRVLSVFVLAAMAAPALAQVNGFAPPALAVDLPPVYETVKRSPSEGSVRLGSRAIELEKTKLTALASDMRVPVGERGDASTSLHWICLQMPTQRVWLTSDEIGGGRIDGVTLAALLPGQKPDKQCHAAQAKIALPHGLALGMTADELKALFGKPSYVQGPIQGYVFEKSAGEGQLSSRLWVRLAAGKVEALELGQMTVF